jgi:hypothetical protein
MNLSKLKQAEAAFLHQYPGGFENPALIAIRRRKHKPDQMIALAQESFSKGNFRLPDLIVQNMEKAISRSSIISVFEKMRFREVIGTLSPQEKEWLSTGLEELLNGIEQTGFEMILDLLKSRNLAKWSVMTVCQTYVHPQRDVFVKPTTVKGVIQYFELNDLQYRPTPSWAFYDAYRSVFHDMKSRVDRSLSPTNPAFSGFLLMSIHGDFFR